MQVSVEKISNVERRLTIVVPADQMEAAYTKQINKFAKNASIKGFRPGKVPIAYIKKRFGNDARQEALSDVIQTSLYQAIHEQKLQPINLPKVEPKFTNFEEPLEFTALFEVLPEITAINFTMDKIEKFKAEITEADINHVLLQLRKQSTKWNPVDRPVQESDRVVIDYYAIFEGKSEEDKKAIDATAEIGSKTMLPGFEEGLVGMVKGDERTLNLTFPEQFPAKDKAGKPVDFVVQVKQVYEADMPVLDAAFIEKLGVKSGNEADLVTQIRQSLEQERDRLVRDKLKEQVFKALIEQNPIEIPHSLIEKEAKNIHDEIYPHEHKHHEHAPEEMTIFNELAKKRVALGILIGEYAKGAHLKPEKERVEKRIQEIAAIYERPEEVMQWLSSDERRAGLESQVLEDQVMEKLLEQITIEEKVISYAELKNIRV